MVVLAHSRIFQRISYNGFPAAAAFAMAAALICTDLFRIPPTLMHSGYSALMTQYGRIWGAIQ